VAPISPGLVRNLKRLTARRPALGLRLSGELGARLDPGSYWAPSSAEVSELFGTADAREVARLRCEIASRELRNHVVGAVSSKRGMDLLLDCVHVVGGERLFELRREKVPVVIVFWHLGIFRAVPAALAKLGLRALVASKLPPRRPSGELTFQRAQGSVDGALFLKGALAHLADAGVVALSLDCRADEAFGKVDFLGREVHVARGPALLVRLGRARLVPVTSRWIGGSGRMQVVIHEPVAEPPSGGAPERVAAELLAGAVRIFESHVRAHPEDLRVCAVRSLLGRPVD
jgi:lauroyl/myristoyl acyltransferase